VCQLDTLEKVLKISGLAGEGWNFIVMKTDFEPKLGHAA
jgi:hypothetical protein